MSKDPFNVTPKRLGQLWPTLTAHEVRAPGDSVVEKKPGIIARNTGLEVYTQLSQEKIQGLANRDPVTPLFREIEKKIHAMAHPGQRMRALLVLSAPGLGKTHSLLSVARLYDSNTPFLSCEGQTGESLLRRVSFSCPDPQTLQERVDGLLTKINRQGGFMDNISAMALRDLGNALQVDELTGGEKKYSIDWQKIGLHDGTTSTDPLFSAHTMTNVFLGLQKFMHAQGVPAEQQHLDVRYVDGIIIQAIKQSRPFVILDEFTRLADYNTLLATMELFMGDRASITLFDADGLPVYCERGKVPILLLAGNEKDIGVTPMPDALISRLETVRLEMPDDEHGQMQNWQHVIETELCGVPIHSFLDAIPQGRDPKHRTDPEGLRDFFIAHYHFGADDETRRLEDWQYSLLYYWPRVAAVSGPLAKVLSGLPAYFSPDYPLYASSENNEPDEIYAKIKRALRRMDKAPRTDFRKIQRLITKATQQPVRTQVIESMDGFLNSVHVLTSSDNSPATGTSGFSHITEPACIEEIIGHQLVTAILEWRDEMLKTVPDHEARGYLLNLTNQFLANHRVINQNGTQVHSILPRIDELLTVTPALGAREEERAALKEIIRLLIEKRFPQFKGVLGDDFISDSELDSLYHQSNRRRLLIPNDKMEADDLSDPLLIVRLNDHGVPENKDRHEVLEKALPSPCVPLESLLKSLTLPVIGKRNLNRLWSRDLSRHFRGAITPEIEIAEGRSDSGLAVTTVLCRGPRKITDIDRNGSIIPSCTLHIWRNQHTDKTLIVSDSFVNNSLVDALQEEGITCIHTDKNVSGATLQRVQNFIHEHLIADDPDHRKREWLIRAHVLRNAVIRKDSGLHANPIELLHIGTSRLLLNKGEVCFECPKSNKPELFRVICDKPVLLLPPVMYR